MEVNQMIELMKAVSETGLTDFCYEENGVVLKLKKHPEKKIVASVAATAPAASTMCHRQFLRKIRMCRKRKNHRFPEM